MNRRLWHPDEYDDLSDRFNYLRPKIMKLLSQQVKIKKIARLSNTSCFSIQLLNPDTLEIMKDYEIKDEDWENYYEYLNFFNYRLQ